eukprot:GHRQ01034996.1.p1 GENE.GHRQ01034996.1~~GHRQ01034996.1.p1  ORF type:complete len:125 (-),score=7.69 GHRQ01034996.1:436-810(-)
MDVDPPATDVPQEAAASLQLQLSLLSVIKSAQLQNGLKHGDYGRYRWPASHVLCFLPLCAAQAAINEHWLLQLWQLSRSSSILPLQQLLVLEAQISLPITLSNCRSCADVKFRLAWHACWLCCT